MTDLQIEKISKLISDLKDFENSIANQTKFTSNPNLKIEYKEDGNLILQTETEKFFVENRIIKGIIKELKEQENRITNFNESINPRMELKKLSKCKYEMSKEYYKDMFYARQISSGYGTYKKKLIKITKIFRLGNTIKYKEKEFLTVDEFTNGLLKRLADFKSIEKELQK